jgi:hypothetical protein
MILYFYCWIVLFFLLLQRYYWRSDEMAFKWKLLQQIWRIRLVIFFILKFLPLSPLSLSFQTHQQGNFFKIKKIKIIEQRLMKVTLFLYDTFWSWAMKWWYTSLIFSGQRQWRLFFRWFFRERRIKEDRLSILWQISFA